MKSYKMQKAAIKDLVYGGLQEIMNNSSYFYRSSVGKDYSHLTERGKEAVVEYMDLMAYKIWQAEQEDLDRRAKEQVLKELKGK